MATSMMKAITITFLLQMVSELVKPTHAMEQADMRPLLLRVNQILRKQGGKEGETSSPAPNRRLQRIGQHEEDGLENVEDKER